MSAGRDLEGTTLLVLGGRSDIGAAVARRFAAAGCDVQLAAREVGRLDRLRSDLEIRHRVRVTLHELDALEVERHGAFVDALEPLPDVALSAIGLLGSQAEDQRDPLASSAVLRANFEGPALLLGALAERFEARGSGTLVGISSVAGERGRASNYVYGSAKAGLTAFLSGLRNRLARRGVHVVTVLPGFVATKMIEGLEVPERLTARPEEVAAAIERALRRRRDVVYVKPLWALVMAAIRGLPEALFKRTSL